MRISNETTPPGYLSLLTQHRDPLGASLRGAENTARERKSFATPLVRGAGPEMKLLDVSKCHEDNPQFKNSLEKMEASSDSLRGSVHEQHM